MDIILRDRLIHGTTTKKKRYAHAYSSIILIGVATLREKQYRTRAKVFVYDGRLGKAVSRYKAVETA